MNNYLRRFSAVAAFLSIFCLPILGQSSYGSVVGTVADSSGAIIPGAAVTLTNSETSENKSTVTNSGGNYQFVNLLPGNYRVAVEMKGFKRLTRTGVQVAVQVSTRVDAMMQVGEVDQQVEVTESAPLLNTEDATVGQVVESRTVSELPLNGRNVMNLIQLTPGVIAHGQSQGQTTRSGSSNYQISGGMAQIGKTELDGTPLNTGLFNGQAFVPVTDTVQEFQVMANDIPAEFGGTLDGVINIATKPGTDQIHFAAYEYIRNKVLNANTFFNNKAGLPRTPFTQNQYGLDGGAPIKHGKTFVFGAWEVFTQRTGSTFTATVPTQEERGGDFSNLRTASGALIPLYDPATNPRTQFPGNKIPTSRFDQTAAIMLNYWPLPTQSGAANTHANNYVVNSSTPNDRNWEHVRVDQVLSSKQRLFATLDRYHNLTPEIDNYRLDPIFNYNQNQGSIRGLIADTYTLNNTTIIDAHLSYSRTIFTRIPNTLGYDLTKIGWPASYASQFLKTQFPVMQPSGMTSSESSQSAVISQYSGTGFLATSLMKIIGRHSIKVGGEFSWLPTAYAQGMTWSFAFNSNFTALNPLSPGNTGFGFASFLLGLGNSGQVSNTLAPFSTMHSTGFYIADKFQPTKRLNLSLGARWDYPGYWIERHGNQGVFLPNATNPVLAAAGLNYAGDVAVVNTAQYPNDRTQYPHWKLFAPRVGLAYRLNDKNVIRSGFGITYAPGMFAEYQLPYEQSINNASTAWVPTQNSGQTAVDTLHSPFPNGINAAPGRNPSYESSLLGSSIIFGTAHNAFPYMENWNIGFERQIGSSSVVDLTYVGTHGVHLTLETDPPGGPDINQLPDANNSMGASLLTSVPNPFFGIVKTGSLAKATIPKGQTLRPYPQYTTIFNTSAAFLDAHYNALEAKFQKRFHDSGSILVSYTYSKNYGNADAIYGHTENFAPGTVQDFNNPSADNSLLSYDVRNLLAVSYVLNLPFGKGEHFLASSNALVSAVVSGWGINGVTSLQSGFPIPLIAQATTLSTSFGAGPPRPNVADGCATTISGSAQARLSKWFNTSCFSQPSSFGYGNEPRVDPNIHTAGIANSDFSLFKNASIAEKFSVQFRAEVFNLFNRVQFGNPGLTFNTPQFGVVSSQANNPRLLQFGLKISR